MAQQNIFELMGITFENGTGVAPMKDEKKAEKISQMEQLSKELNNANKHYYSEDNESSLSDREYDEKKDKLAQLEQETGVVLENSPTDKVGYDVVSELTKVTHEIPALSLGKTKLADDLVAFLGDKEGVLSYKEDGLTLCVTYRNGMLVQAATRGNGTVGEDVTHNAPVIEGLPMSIPFAGKLIVRGEVLISYDDFNEINSKVTDREPYKNPRNLASSSLRLMDANKAKDRKMHFKLFEVVKVNDMDPANVMGSFAFAKENGFDVVEHMLITEDSNSTMADAVDAGINAFKNLLVEYPYATDGLVLAYNDAVYGRSLGTTGHHPKHSIAFKWQDEVSETTLREIEWSASKTGLLNPVAIFDPVEIEGTMVSRASLHNLSYVEDKTLLVGDTITVYKANMIIPQIAENLTPHNIWNSGDVVPKACPVCGGQVSIHHTNLGADDDTATVHCDNPDCSAKHIGKFSRLVERDALNVVGLAESQLEVFASKGWLNKRSDIFHLTDHKDEIIALDGFGEKSYQKIVDAIEKARFTTFRQFFYSLGINGAGHDAAKVIEKNAQLLSDKLVTKSQCKSSILPNLKYDVCKDILMCLDGIGTITAHEIVEWFKANAEEYALLRQEVSITDDTIEVVDESTQDLAGMVFVITGGLNTYDNRDQLKAEIESRGGKVSGSVSAKTTYLINNDVNSTTGKNKKAQELGIPIISEEEYKNL